MTFFSSEEDRKDFIEGSIALSQNCIKDCEEWIKMQEKWIKTTSLKEGIKTAQRSIESSKNTIQAHRELIANTQRKYAEEYGPKLTVIANEQSSHPVKQPKQKKKLVAILGGLHKKLSATICDGILSDTGKEFLTGLPSRPEKV